MSLSELGGAVVGPFVQAKVEYQSVIKLHLYNTLYKLPGIGSFTMVQILREL